MNKTTQNINKQLTEKQEMNFPEKSKQTADFD